MDVCDLPPRLLIHLDAVVSIRKCFGSDEAFRVSVTITELLVRVRLWMLDTVDMEAERREWFRARGAMCVF